MQKIGDAEFVEIEMTKGEIMKKIALQRDIEFKRHGYIEIKDHDFIIPHDLWDEFHSNKPVKIMMRKTAFEKMTTRNKDKGDYDD